MEEKRIIRQGIEKQMQHSYIDYSMSVIVGRALPDARDGLKPVHRRILYAMHGLGLQSNRPFKKSATVVGEVLGKYHPHGDTAAYDSMVRMAQPFAMRYVLVDGQGNFGSVDGDSAAAMRYTEARLSKVSNDVLEGLDKETVDMVDNFDGSLKEPSVLPSRLPQLLVNGSHGIAVGMATKMPPHNLAEVCSAIKHVIAYPDATVSDIMEHLPGPDFPTGGTIYGLSGIISAYETGRGRFKVRANTHFEPMPNGKKSIIVDELPYQVNKARLIENIAEQVRNKTLEHITDLRDESDRSGMRIVIELHRDALENVVLENLFRKTQMETTFGVINLALVDGRPTMMGIRALIGSYLGHRKEVITRSTRYDLTQAERRFHVVEGLMKALGMLDETIALIRASESGEEANLGLQSLLGIDQEQAKAILDMRLQRLTGLEIGAIEEEHRDLQVLMADLRDILASEQRVLDIIVGELDGMIAAHGDPRRTVINEQALDIDEEDLIERQEVVITISADDYIKRIPLRTYREQGRGGVGLTGMRTKEDDHVKSMFVASSHDYLMFITNRGRLHWLKGYRVSEGSRQSRGKPIINLLPDLEPGERVVDVIRTAGFDDQRQMVFCTRNGIVKKTLLRAYSNVRARGIKAIRIDDDDELVETAIIDGGELIMLATRNGMVCTFDEDDARTTGRDTRGVKGITLMPGDMVVSMAAVRPGDRLLTVTENGFGKISDVSDYRLTRRGAKGVITIRTDRRNGKVVAVRRVERGGHLMATSRQGKIIRIEVDGISEQSRRTRGVILMDMRDDDTIIAVQAIAPEGDSGEAEG
jgi:DNA gyrase subunit A